MVRCHNCGQKTEGDYCQWYGYPIVRHGLSRRRKPEKEATKEAEEAKREALEAKEKASREAEEAKIAREAEARATRKAEEAKERARKEAEETAKRVREEAADPWDRGLISAYSVTVRSTKSDRFARRTPLVRGGATTG